MTITVEELLAGPRGRKLCLEHAVRCAHAAGRRDVTDAVLHRSVTRDDATAQFGTGPVGPHPQPRVSEVAALLDQVPITEPDDDALLGLLDIAAVSARYWQSPDGDDLLAAEPEMRDALTRVAARIAAAAGTNWWSQPLDASRQHRVRWVVDRPVAPPERGVTAPSDVLATWWTETVDDERRARRERPADPAAPFSGLWWSRPPYELLATTRDLGMPGPAGLWLVEDPDSWAEAFVAPVTVSPGSRVWEIAGPHDWAELCRRHPLDLTAARKHDWFRTTGRAGDWVVPDWSQVAAEADAVHLTVSGWLTTAGLAIPVGDGVASVLAGWDPDQTYWLTDIARPGGPEVRWRRDPDGYWEPA